MGIKMGLISPASATSDDAVLIQKIVRNGLISLSIAIIALSAAAIGMFVKLTDFHHEKVHITDKQSHLLHMMRIAARERSLLLYQMVTETDPFLSDELKMAYDRAGTKFAHSRNQLMKFPLTENEKTLLAKQGLYTRENQPKQNKITDLVAESAPQLALKLLQEQAIPGQIKVIRELDSISQSIDKRSNEIKIKADSLGQASIVILLAIAIIVIASAVYIIRQTTFRSFNLINQLNQAQKSLKNTVDELSQQKNTLDHHAIVSITDRAGNITYANKQFCKTSGYSSEELIGKNHRILRSGMHSEEFYNDLWKTISKGNVWHGKVCNKKKDGTHYWVESTISPFLNSKGIPYQYVSIRTEITVLLTAKLQAEEASRSKSLFLSSISHELRTPMNAILGFAQIIDMKTEDDSTKDYVNEVLNAGRHLLELFNEILELSQIESGTIEIFPDNYSLQDILTMCMTKIVFSAKQLSIKINNNVAKHKDVKIYADEKRITQIILNILSNAIRYNKKNGQVTVDYSIKNENILTLTISDTGYGIPSDKKNSIFNPFDRAGRESSNIAGSGLGLVISKKLIEKMNGSIGFESTENEGSCFWINIPLTRIY